MNYDMIIQHNNIKMGFAKIHIGLFRKTKKQYEVTFLAAEHYNIRACCICCYSRFRSYFQRALCCLPDPILGDHRLSRNCSRRYSQYSDWRRSSFVPSYPQTREITSPLASRVGETRATFRRGEQIYKWRNELNVPDIRMGQELLQAETSFR